MTTTQINRKNLLIRHLVERFVHPEDFKAEQAARRKARAAKYKAPSSSAYCTFHGEFQPCPGCQQ